MALKDFLQLVVNELATSGVLLDNTLHLGTSSRAQKTIPPAIFWVPKSGAGSGPMIAMPLAIQTAYFAANPGKAIPRALHTRMIMLEIHLWGGPHSSSDDFSSTEALIDATLSAIHHNAYGCYHYIGEEWVPSGTDIMTLGRRCVLNVEIAVPVLEVAFPAVKVTSLPVTTQMGPIPPGGSTVTNP